MASQPLVGTRAQGHGQGFDIQDLSISAIATSSATWKRISASFDCILQWLVWWRFLKFLGFLHIITIFAGLFWSLKSGSCKHPYHLRLGFVMCNVPEQLPGVVKLLAESPALKTTSWFWCQKKWQEFEKNPMLWTLLAYLYRYFKLGLLESYLASLTLTWFAYLNHLVFYHPTSFINFMLLASFAHRFLAYCWQYISSMLFTMAIRLQSSCALCCGNGTWHCLCWHSFAGGNTSDSTCDTVKCQGICNALYVECGQLSKNLQEFPDCFQLSDSLTCSVSLMFVYDLHFWYFSTDLDHTGRPTICFSRWCLILLTLSGASTTNPINRVPPTPFDSSISSIPTLVCSQARSYSRQRLSG